MGEVLVYSGGYTSYWKKVGKGESWQWHGISGPFVAAMSWILRIPEAEKEYIGLLADSGQCHPACKTFMDDITVMMKSMAGTRGILNAYTGYGIVGTATVQTSQIEKPCDNERKVVRSSPLIRTIFHQCKTNQSNAWENCMTPFCKSVKSQQAHLKTSIAG